MKHGNFMWDEIPPNSIYCGQTISWVMFYMFSNQKLYVVLPSDFEQYWKEVRGNARTDWRKAIKNKCSIKKIEKLNKLIDRDIIEIWNSTDIRQDRPMNRMYTDLMNKETLIVDEWPIRDYGIYNCPHHNLEFWIVEKDKKIVAYLELLNCGNISIVHTLLGHFDFLKYGIMKYLFIEVSKEQIKRGIKYLFYGFEEHLKQDLRFFLRDLNIINILNLENLPPRLIEQLKKPINRKTLKVLVEGNHGE